MEKFLSAIVILALIAVGVWYFVFNPMAARERPIATVSYVCADGKTIRASFYEGTSTPPASPDQPGVPGGRAQIALSDGRLLTLPQTISADGIRYANADQSIIFWSKGDGAFVLERDQQTYVNCADSSKVQ